MRSTTMLIACLTLAALLPMAGCSGDGGGVLDMLGGGSADKAMALLPDSVKSATNGYLSSLDGITETLGSIQKFSDALSAIPQLQPLIKQFNDATSMLSSLTPETRSNVVEAFGPQLTEANNGFTNQLNRVMGDSTLPDSLSQMLKDLKLFG